MRGRETGRQRDIEKERERHTERERRERQRERQGYNEREVIRRRKREREAEIERERAVAYPGGFYGCPETPPPAMIFFIIRWVTPLLTPTFTSHFNLRLLETP